MPGFNRSGPQGQGPLTGRGLGPCGRGLAFRRGLGRGFAGRRIAFTPVQPVVQPIYQEPILTKEEEKKILEAELAEIKVEMEEIEKRLKEIK